jgi:dienelactone hydrolase
VKAGVAWYGRLVGPVNDFTPRHPTDLVGQLKAPVLGLYGGLDTGIPLETVEAMEKALQQGSAAAKASEIHVRQRAACLPCRLPPQLPQGRGRGWLEADARLVPQKRRVKRHFEAERAPSC